MKLIASEDICIRVEAIIQNSKWTRKLSLQPKWFAGLGSWAARGKEIRVFSAFCSRLRAGYVKRVETIRLSSVSDPKKKIAGIRVSTISPVIASSRYPLLLRAKLVTCCRLGFVNASEENETMTNDRSNSTDPDPRRRVVVLDTKITWSLSEKG